MRRLLRHPRLLLAGAIGAAFAIGFLVASERESQAKGIERVQVYADVPEADRIGAPSSDAHVSEQHAHVATWSQQHYAGKLTTEAVEKLVVDGMAGSLERHLGEEAAQRLRQELRPLEGALTEAIKLTQLETDAVKRQLRDRPDRQIRIASKQREQDANYQQILDARRAIEDKGLGAIWGDYIDGKEVHFVIKWEEWPILKGLFDEQFELIRRRKEWVRRWVEAEYERHGMARSPGERSATRLDNRPTKEKRQQCSTRPSVLWLAWRWLLERDTRPRRSFAPSDFRASFRRAPVAR